MREHLRRALPEYMVPSAFVLLDEMPLSPNGKVDRKALPAPERAEGEDACVAPRTPVEEVLAGIWAEVLRLERVGAHDNFFELGGHSLLATRVVSRVRQIFAIELPLRALFEGPTLAEMAKAVEDERRRELPVLPPVVPVERTGALPLSFAQERLWFIDRLEPESAVYNIPVAWRLEGALDGAALERALGEIVRRHEALRTVFAEVNGSPVQVIAPFAGFTLPVDDLSGLGEADREAAVGQRAGEEARRTFDLSADPLFRAALLRLGDEDHVLLLSMHHIVSDGWSLGVLRRELSALYAAYREGRESPLAGLAVQYADYAVWQREQLTGEALDRQLAYWKERLADAPALLELPTDHPRPPAQTYRGGTVPVELSPELMERLQALGRSEGATLYMTVLGAFQVLLSRYAGSEDVVVGSPIAGRTRGEVEELIGLFVNTLVLRTDLSGDPSFREVLGQVREVTLGAYEHQELPFEKLVAELQPERSLTHSPLFQVLFRLENAEGPGDALAGLKMSRAVPAMEIAKLDLSLILAATPQGLRGGLNYSTDLFERGTIERMLGHLERVLEQVATDADVRLSRLELLGEAERALVLEAWNRTDAEYAAASCIHELFEQQVERAPDALALACGSVRLSYTELNARANRLAHHLRSRGVRPDARVAISLERGPGMVVALLAVLKAGGAYVPLDPEYPSERLAYMLKDSAPALLLTTGALVPRFADAGVPILDLTDEAPWAGAPATDPERGGLRPEHAAYLIYTSGSTGRPKGAMIQHRNVCGMVAGQVRSLPLEAESRILQFASFSFDGHVFEVFLALARGASLHLPEHPGPLAGDDLVRTVAEAGITHAIIPPAVLAALPDDERLPSIHTLIVSGDAPPVDLMARWSAGRRLINGYGPTEATVCTTLHDYVPGGSAPPPIGRPVANVRVYLLDAAGEPVPRGVRGELYIGGAMVGRGYWRRAALTAERFVPDPFGAQPGARLYRTGDLARWNAEGALEFAGRVDAQVKVRGFRIELGEIEAALRRSEGVADCVVVAREDVPGEKRLVAYVVGGVEAGVLREHLRRKLPEYMVPAAFVVLEALPLTPNGKLDRRALPAPEYADADRYVAPRTPVEEVLAGIWEEVLGLERVGAGDDFFELGGHSILTMLVASLVRELLGVELPVRVFFEGPTVAKLAKEVEEVRRAGLPVLPPVVPAGRTGALPLSFAQERLWFLDRMEPGSAVYNMPAAWRLGGALNEAALERSLGEIVRRHEALRTVFAEVDGSPVQVVVPFGGFALPVEELSALGEADRAEAVRRRAVEEAGRAFDLAAGPLFRAVLLRLGAEDHVLLLTMHHIVSDGWSMGVLFRELAALYGAYREGRESPLPELAVQYADYAVWQREQLAGEVLDRQLAYWKERLAGAPELLELPTDHPRPAVQTYRGASVPVDLSLELLERLQALGRSEGATLYMTLLSAFQVLLGKYAGSEDVVVGSPIAGRTRAEVEELIGFFVHTLVLRTDLSGDPSFRDVLGRVREATLGAYEHQEVPFEKLVADLQPERSLSHSPLFQVMFALQNAAGGGGALPGLEVSGVGAELATTKFDLALSFAAYPQGLRGVLAYSTDLFERSTVRRMLVHLEQVLEQVALKPDVRLSELDLLAAEEREQVLGTWNRTERGSFDPPAHLLFAGWARRAPEAIALLEGGEAVTYGTLDRRASILARHLRGLGVVPETPVGLCMERTPELLVGVLGIWKAGGAYVPLDPGYPAERLGWILTDAAVPVVVATRGTAGVLPEHGATLVRVDQLPDTASETADAAPEVPVSDASLAYVIYTSGSTGRPKGVLVQHGSLANLLGATRETFGVREGDVMPALASYAFDIWLFEALLPLTSGAAVRLVERERVLDVPALLEEIADATLVHAVPALMRQLVQVERERPRLSRLRRAFVGGDRVPADLLAEMREALPGAESHVLYGPTEGTILASTHPVPADGGVEGHPIGRPLGNVRLYVCDRPGSPQPAGIPGELLIGGAGVARGYLGRSAMTAERFVPDPFSTQGGTRLYRTGDRARWRADGTLEYLGRLDAQVKVRGFRIEPGEIEAVLRQHESVGECAVVVREDEVGDPRLAAYVVPVPRKDIELWPSIGEYFVYDDLIYHGLTHDTGRNERYLRALRRHAPGKVVLDVGTGADAILARLAVEAGARHVYAVELLERSYLSARERVRGLGLEDRITVIHGDARTVELPEPAEVCVSEIVEAIAGGEGAAVILNQARRLLAPGAVMIPGWARTRVAAVTLPDELRHQPGFSPTAAHYVRGIFEEVGHPFDLRLCIRNFPADHVLSTAGTYEELDFGAGPVEGEYVRREELAVERAGRMDGLLLWLRMELAEGEELDILEEETAWFPVYFPLFEPGIEVAAGDRLRLECWAQIPEGVAPDYGARGVLVRGRGGEEVPFEFVSYHHRQVFRASPFYRRLFTDGEVPSLQEQGETLPASLREHVRRSLPEYMVPGSFVVLEALPLTPNGKLDRKALPAPEHAAGADLYVAPRTPVEEVLAGIWAEVLRRERVGVTESFFELGGHSLLATRVVSRIREVFAVELPLRAVFESPTVADLAERVEEMRRAELPVLPPVVPVVPVERTGTLPLSFAQERLWFLDRLEPGSATYNIPVAWRLAGALDERALERSLSEIVRRHEALRTVFAEVDGSPVQVVAPFGGFTLPVDDLSGLAAADREVALRQRAGEEARRVFDLSAGPLFRAALLRLGEEDHVLLLSMHHIVSDGWSMGVLLRELSALYAAYREGRESPLAELAVQYADYAVWQREQLEGEALDRQLSYWRERLAGAPELLELPTDRPRPPVRTYRGATVPVNLSPELLERLQALGRSEGATLYMTLLGAFQVLLSKYGGSEDIVVGSPIAGRTRAEVEELIGLFVNTLVLRTDLSGDPAFREVLGRVREVTLGAYAHQEVPFERLVAELQPERSLSHSPLFQVMFALQNAEGGGGDLPGLEVSGVGADLTSAKFDLSLTLATSAHGLRGGLDYSTDLFQRGTVDRMLGHLARVLEQVAADADVRLSQLELLGEAERALVLEAWNRTDAEYSADRCIHELFEAQAARTPDAVAVVFADESLTYAELDARANRLAHYLRGLGAGPETRVGICVDRSAEMVVAMLAVLKSGAAYLPLDPSYPADRLAYMLRDSGAPLLVTQDSLRGLLPTDGVRIVPVDGDAAAIASHSADAPRTPVDAANAAYVIYTSGSTGRPKGVQVTHGNVVSFFAGMDERVGGPAAGTWLAVTRISFDIHVLELLWTLARGFRVVVQPEQAAAPAPRVQRSTRPMDFSLFYFSSGGHEGARDKYRLLLDGARFADTHGFSAVWTPERHFHAFGGAFPNPSVVGAAVAAVTRNIGIRAGSVVLPLHDPVRVAEEWSVVDNLSGGRVAISIASGWQPNDFVLKPENYADRKNLMFSGIQTVRSLWKGESLTRANGVGKETPFRILPRPVQAEIPVWVTAGGSPDTFRMAGEAGASLLTHLLGQSVDELADKVRIYREAYRASGAAGEGHVSLMIHTFVGDDLERVRQTVRDPFRAYLATSLDLVKPLAQARGIELTNGRASSDEDMNALLDLAFERYWQTSGLMGTPETCGAMIDRLKAAGVDEVACLIDFVDDVDAVLAALPMLDVVRREANATADQPADPGDEAREDERIAAQIERYGVTHLQCTPSLAAMMIAESGIGALSGLERILLGGEALPPELAAQITDVLPNGLVNMYGPTETTVWSASHAVEAAEGPVPIGRPIANTRVYVLDAALRPQPAGVPGELFIGGHGVTRGYLARPGLTAERFVPDAFSARPGARLYRTGDRARWTAEGVLEYLGRLDAQVKVRGFRIEPGEIEAVLRRHPAVVECAVVARAAGAGDTRLVAYVVGAAEANTLRAHAGRSLPDYMVPSAFVPLDALPLTPNGTLDRRALPAPGDDAYARRGYEAPVGETEEALVGIWAELLGLERVGRWDNFFELGGSSLLALRLLARVRSELGCDLPVATLFVGGTVRHMAEAVRAHGEPAAAPEAAPLVPLRATGTLPPLFVVHPAGRRVANYATLVERLGPDQPVYGLQDVGDDLARPVERIAAEHLRAVRAVQPHGPYHLAGWSFGGVVAYEMAVQLERAGERVAFAGVLDTVAPPFVHDGMEPDEADLVLGLARDVAAQMGRPFTLSADALAGAGLDEQLRRAAEALHAQGAAPDRFDAADLRGHVEVIRARNRATAAYRPGAYGGPLTLFAAADNPVEFASWFGLRTDEEARTYGWCRLAPAAR
ncbi:MAG TPA: amino acid adenylation domain-containing protein, partial [Longimicrobium sp.]